MLKQLDFVMEEVQRIPQIKLIRLTSSFSEGIRAFILRTKKSFITIFEEPEILVFAVLQLSSVALGYFLWVQILSLFPPKEYDKSLSQILLVIWSFLVIGFVALPLGILSGAMGMSHFLRSQGMKSTFSHCLSLSIRRYWQLWIFSWIDSQITIDQILERLPKKGERTISAQKAMREATYLAWKVATLGVLPSVLNGRDLIEAGRESLLLLKKRFSDVVLLRVGYSALCWMVGLAGYLFTIYLVSIGWFPAEIKKLGHFDLYLFYLYAGYPVIVSAAVVVLFLRPVFILSCCSLYAQFVKVEKLPVNIPLSESTILKIFFTAFVIVLLLVALVILYLNHLEAV